MTPALDEPTERRVSALRDGARRGQWRIEDAIDRRVTPRAPRFLPRRYLATALGALIAGEEATAAACGTLAATLPPGATRDCLVLQRADEARHAACYRHYLDRLGLADDPPAGFRAASAALADWRGPPAGQLIAVHVVLESEALAAQAELLDDVACPLYAAFSRRIARDEARHVAFGRLLGPAIARELGADGRRATLAEIQRIWRACVAALSGDSLLLRRPIARFAERRWAEEARTLHAIGFAEIRP